MHFQQDTDPTCMLRDRIARRAYELWEQRGRPEGSSELDWYQAEREIEGLAYEDLEASQFLYTVAI